MYQAPGVGLAAPQVGLSLRFFVYDDGDGSGPDAWPTPWCRTSEGSDHRGRGMPVDPQPLLPDGRGRRRVRIDGVDVDGRPVSMLEGEGSSRGSSSTRRTI